MDTNMISISLVKDDFSGKQFVDSWYFVSKEHADANPTIPGKKIYLETDKVPVSFYSDPQIHYYESGKLIPVYPNHDLLSKKFKE